MPLLAAAVMAAKFAMTMMTVGRWRIVKPRRRYFSIGLARESFLVRKVVRDALRATTDAGQSAMLTNSAAL